MSRPARALWIEIRLSTLLTSTITSRPARALWIEIGRISGCVHTRPVEAREGLVD